MYIVGIGVTLLATLIVGLWITLPLKQLISQTQKSGIQITKSASQIAATGKQLEATVTQQAASTNQVSATSHEIAATSGQLVKTMDQIAQRATRTALEASNSQADLMQMEGAMRSRTKLKFIRCHFGKLVSRSR